MRVCKYPSSHKFVRSTRFCIEKYFFFRSQLKPLLIYEGNRQLRKFVQNLPPAQRLDAVTTGESSTQYFLQRIIKYLGLEPIKLPTFENSLLGVNFKATNLVMYGLSVIDEVNSLYVQYKDQTFYLESEVN